jgi:hypothetical protein
MSTSGPSPDLQNSLASKRLVQVPVAFLSAAVALFVAWPKLGHDVLSSAYMPHLYCYLGSTSLAWTHAIADTLIGLAYVVISATLAYLIYRGRSDLPFHGLFFAFAAFIVACGSSHLGGGSHGLGARLCVVSGNQGRHGALIDCNRSDASIRGS